MTFCLPRWTEGGRSPPLERMSLRPYLVVSAPSTGVSSIHEVKNVPLLVKNEEHVREMRSFNWGPLPPSVYLGGTKCHSRDEWTRPSPSVFAYCKRSKAGRLEGLGTMLDLHSVGLHRFTLPCYSMASCYVLPWLPSTLSKVLKCRAVLG